MFDSQCDLAALVYQRHEDPDAVLREFAGDIAARGFRAVGLVQLGHRVESGSLSAMLIHTGATVRLFQELGAGATGCKLDVGQLLEAASQVANGIDEGADVVIINRYGKQEREGRGLSYLIERALDSDVPVVIAVPDHRFAEWINFAGGMSVKLPCSVAALVAWWDTVSAQAAANAQVGHIQKTFCEALK
jgi:Protein of unknown function (DUF2478)